MGERMLETDVLVVGGGGAGFRAAIGARESGAKALLLSKGPLARCGATPMAGADFTLDGRSLSRLGFPGAPGDTEEKFFNDIVTQGYYLNNQKLVEQYIRSAPARLKELLDWGLKVNFSEERAIFTSGIGLMDVLLNQARAAGVDMLEDTMLLDLLVEDGRIAGGLGLDVRTGDFLEIKAKAAVMATGGWHKAFWPNTGMRDLSGDGIAMAHRAGAELGNMEFITFCCNILLYPPVWRGSLATYILGLLSGGELTNTAGEAFLQKYDSYTVEKGTTMEWNKGFISFATSKEVREGKGSPNGGVYYGLGKVRWEDFENASAKTIFPNWKYKAMDLGELAKTLKSGGMVEVGPAVEYFDGGVVVNEKFETKVPGLYAAGECTLGPFGSNRVCSAITEMLVHGADAGKNAGGFGRAEKGPEVGPRSFRPLREKARMPLDRKDGLKPAQVRRLVQETAHKLLGPIRNGEELTRFLHFLDRTNREEVPRLATASKNPIYNKEWLDALELANLVHLLTCAAQSALFRTESRGVHYREEFPFSDNDNWMKESRVIREEDALRVSSRPVTVTTLTPPSGRIPFLDMMKKMMQSRSDIGGHH
jgi:succinate dehydrogenase/fumarate reductase flavoprotein subunit